MKPEITVLMSIYNEPEKWLRESIESILNQTFKDFEFLIVNDNPLSESNKVILSEFKKIDNRIRVINNSTNLGLTKSLNNGLKSSNGKYIARMDADDISMIDRLEIQYNFMEDNQACTICGSWMNTFSEDQKVSLVKYPTNSDDIKNLLYLDNAICHPTAFIRNSVLQSKAIIYNESYKYSQDYAFWCKLANYGDLNNIPQPLINYRISGSQISKSKLGTQNILKGKIRLEYLTEQLKKYNIDISGQSVERQICEKINPIDQRRYMLSSFYTNRSLMYNILNPLFSGNVFLLKKLYFSSLRRNKKTV